MARPAGPAVAMVLEIAEVLLKEYFYQFNLAFNFVGYLRSTYIFLTRTTDSSAVDLFQYTEPPAISSHSREFQH
ncbi:hypothetical protein D9757_012022 [Collybiopsis confluens]|uniref:Uncharacterized protein n=1 Tax=Collybiopsis confluens TaxID=2823264 RepID=A0A8H5LUX6_9AGAR|nr:hypothetical protein D9757_012022 [Collybiopsis confluens]